jgi:hypothetical protein
MAKTAQNLFAKAEQSAVGKVAEPQRRLIPPNKTIVAL